MNRIVKALGARLRAALIVMFVLSAFLPTAASLPVAQAASPNLVIYEVYGGGGNSSAPYTNDFVVLFNRGSAVASLEGMSLQYAGATGTGNFAANRFVLPAITLAPGQYFLAQMSGGAVGSPLPTADVIGSTSMSASGGKVVLVNSPDGLACNGYSTPCSTAQLALIVDLVGYGSANFSETSPAPAASNTTAVARKNGCADTDNNATDFQTQAPSPLNMLSAHSACAGGDAAPHLTGISPVQRAGSIAVDANLTVTFNEPVITTGSWFTIACSLSGGHTAAVSGGPSTFTLDPNDNFMQGETCTVTVLAAQVADQDAEDPPDSMWTDFSWSFTTLAGPATINQIQAAGHKSPFDNRLVSNVNGIVTARTNQGFYMQDPAPDADLATSDAIYVFTSSAPAAQVGDAVRVDAKVVEFRPGGDANNLSVTQLTAPTVTVLSNGNTLPSPVVIGTGGRVPPNTVIENDADGDVEASGVFDPESDGLDFYESLEAMRVQLNDAVVIGPRNSYGEVPVVGDNGTNAGLRTPRGGLLAQPDDFNPERVMLDDEVIRSLSPAQQMPNMNVGDSLSGAIIGVVDYSFGLFKLQVALPPTVTPGGITREVAQEPGEGQLAVASFNTENLSALDAQSRFDTLAGLIINNLRSPDVLALEEIQDNNGPTNDSTVDADLTLNRLATAIKSLGGPQYSFKQINPVDDQDGGQTGGNIRVAFLFRTDRGLSFVDRAGGTSTGANSVIFDSTGLHLRYSPGRIDPTNSAFADSRKPLAGEFLYNGKRIFIIANHFNSKGGDQPLFGRFQPPALASETQRIQQAQVVHDFVQSILQLDTQANVIVLGDLNDFQFSNPLNVLKGSPAILTPLIERLPLAERYTYVYEGNAQALDHILVSSALAGRPLVYDSVHVNSEFFDQASDHDPQLLIVSLQSQDTYLPMIFR